MKRCALFAVAALLLACPLLADMPQPEILLARSPDSSVHNWGALPAMLGLSARFESRDDGTLPQGDLSRYKLIILSTNLNVFESERRRLWEFANRGGILVTWFPDDKRYDSRFWPYRLVLSDNDPPKVTFRDEDHPLLKGLRGKVFEGQMRGGDVVRDWDRDHWRVLADSPNGPALLVAEYGAGHIVDVQFHGPMSSLSQTAGPIAENLIEWAKVARVDPGDLSKRTLPEVLEAVARRQMSTLRSGEWTRGTWEQVTKSRRASGIRWNYPFGVTLYGILRLAQVADNAELSEYVLRHNSIVAGEHAWLLWQRQTFNEHVDPGGIHSLMRLACLDDCGSMASQVVEGIMEHDAEPSAEMLAMLERVANYIHKRQSRFADGSLCRGRTLWIDDLYMSVPFLARWGAYTGKQEYLDDAALQIVNFASRLQDKDGLWFHGWLDREGKPSPYKWGRGNGWSFVSQAELLSLLPEDHPRRPELLAIYRKHVEGLKKNQAASGMWRQIVDREDLWEETSCTGMFAYGIARGVNRGWIGPENMPVARKAVEALKTRVAWDGSVLGTCAGTGINRSLDYYRQRPQPVNDGHGPGPVLLAGAEVLAAK